MTVAIAALGLMLARTSGQSRDAFRWVTHSQEMIISLDTVMSDLRKAESGLRGYILVGTPEFLPPIPVDLAEARERAAHVAELVADNPAQSQRAERLVTLTRLRSDIILSAVDHARLHPWQPGQVDRRLFWRAKGTMDQLDRLTATLREAERLLLVARADRAEREQKGLHRLMLIGLPVLALLVLGATWFILISINRPLNELLGVVGRFGAGDREARAPVQGRSLEFGRLARAYNDMADTLAAAMNRSGVAEAELAQVNADLVGHAHTLERRSRSVSLVSEMAQRMQAVRGADDLEEVLRCFLPKLLRTVSGALFVHNNSRNRLVQRARWGDPVSAPDAFGPEDCWALRRGQPHGVQESGADVACAHYDGDPGEVERHCEPLLAGGEVLGLLYVEGALDQEQRFRLGLVVETVALALVNEGLRRRLREQSIRDPLTGLFNRRYLEESVSLETARAARGNLPLAVVMADVDHFKRFNDTHGHAAGDLLLKAVAEQLRAHFRDGDLVCRYGGEEFTIITPGATLEQVARRAEVLRQALHAVTVPHNGRLLGPVTMSFGIACWHPGTEPLPANLLAEADQALYNAKRLGRDRIEPALPVLAIAAE